MKQTREAFEERGVKSFYNSLAPEAKRMRWQQRQEKIETRKNKIDPKTVSKIVENTDAQPTLFDLQ